MAALLLMPASPARGRAERVAFVGTYPPSRCGIATFTHDLRAAVARGRGAGACPVVALAAAGDDGPWPAEVLVALKERDLAGYRRAAGRLNRAGVDLVCVQHEFGIYGGAAGGHLLTLVEALKAPVVIVFHTVLRDPDPEQRRVMAALIRLAARVVVMTERGRRFLLEENDAPPWKIEVVAHGIHECPAADPVGCKKRLAAEGRPVLLTFGLLSPNKGIEHVLEALPAIAAEFPAVLYVVLGATHPKLVREQGEVYRRGLEKLARERGVERNVVFHDRFATLAELQEFLGATDIYLTPYLNERQIVSGTLAYAFGAGNAVVSTPYWHAAELLADGLGVLVPFADAGAIAREVGALLRDAPRREGMRRKARELGRDMTWTRTAARYRSIFERAMAAEVPPLPACNPAHVLRLSDSTGILQHALHTVPNRAHGYCTDDNARALLLTTGWRAAGVRGPGIERLADANLAFLAHALDGESGRFRNFMDYDRRWQAGAGSEDAHGRALWALGECAAEDADAGRRALAAELFTRAMPAVSGLEHPRAWAFSLLGLCAFLRRGPKNGAAVGLRAGLAGRLARRFEEHARDDWHWLADDATYDNARLPQAMIETGMATDGRALVETGLCALAWLMRMQTAESGWFRPIGSDGFCHRDGTRADFDQQPVEVQATVSACLSACRATGDADWLDRAELAFGWFLGRNDLGIVIGDAETGGCRDALHRDRANENQGAESSLAFQLALAELTRARAARYGAVEAAAG